MKIKLNKEQIAYINGIDSPEAKKEFLMECFLGQCEEKLESENLVQKAIDIARQEMIDSGMIKIEQVDPIDSETLQKMNDLNEFGIVFAKKPNSTIEELSDKVRDIIAEENLLKFDLPKQESLSKDQLKDITKPTLPKNFLDKWLDESIHVTEYGVRPIHNFKLLEEFKNYEPPHPDKVKKYTKEDMEKCFNESRLTNQIVGFKHDSFEDYLSSI